MYKIIFTMSLLPSLIFSYDLSVQITDIKNKKGKVYIGLFNKAKGFTEIPKAYKRKIATISATHITYVFKDLAKGKYAVAVFHDENNNAKFDKNILGVPKEAYGVSNNKRFLLRAATYKESMFQLESNKKIVIKIGE